MSGNEVSAALEVGPKAGDQPQQLQPDGGTDEGNTKPVGSNSATVGEDVAPAEEKKLNPIEGTTEPFENREADTIGEGEPNAGTVEEKEVIKKDSTISEEKKPADSAVKAEQPRTRPDRRENIKFDPSLLPESDDPEEIRKQANISFLFFFPAPACNADNVEFYFSDSNLPFDKFLFGLVGKDNRAVPLKLICSFKRMRRFPNKDTVLSALQASEMLVVSGDPGEEAVRRKVPVENVEVKTEEPKAGERRRFERPAWDINPIRPVTDRTIPMSIYAKGFGEETGTTQTDVEKLFEPYGPIASVRLRRAQSKLFKGSVFVEFANEELMAKFMALEQKPKWNERELMWLTKDAYVKGKLVGIKEGRVKPKPQQPSREPRESQESRGNSRGRGRGDRGRGRGRNDRGRGGGGHGGRGNNGGRKNNGIPKIGIKSNGPGIPQVKTGTNGNTTPTATSELQKQGEKRKAEETPQTPETKTKSEEPTVTSQKQGEKRKAEETPQTPETKKVKSEEPTATAQKQGEKRKAEEAPQTPETKKLKSEEPTVTAQKQGEKRKAEETPQTQETKKVKPEEPTVTA